MTEMLTSDSPPAWRASVRHHKAISPFINVLVVLMNLLWRIARAPKGQCLHSASSALHLILLSHAFICMAYIQ